MVNQQLVQYIQQQMQRGYQPQQIRTFLVGQGYNAADVDAAIAQLSQDRVASLTTYIKQEMAKGSTPEFLRGSLLKYGYQQADVDAALKQVQGTHSGKLPVPLLILGLFLILAAGALLVVVLLSFGGDADDDFEPPDFTVPEETEELPQEGAEEEQVVVPEEEPAVEETPDEEEPEEDLLADQEPIDEPEQTIPPPKFEYAEEDVQEAANICLSSREEGAQVAIVDACFYQLAKASGDDQFCMQISQTKTKDDCFWGFVLQHDRYDLCSELSDTEQEFCYSLE